MTRSKLVAAVLALSPVFLVVGCDDDDDDTDDPGVEQNDLPSPSDLPDVDESDLPDPDLPRPSDLPGN